MKKPLYSLVLLLVLATAVPAAAQTTWYVDDDCDAPGTGTAIDPFCKIQDGVDASSDGDIVLVAPGTYTGDGNRDISLFGKVITLKSADGPEVTTIDIEGGPDSIHRGFFLIHGETRETVIEGLTITNGYLIGDTGGSGAAGGGGGAAIYIRDSSPTIRDCVLRENTSATLGVPFLVDGRGGGIYVDGVSATLLDRCAVTGNTSQKRGGGLYIGYAETALTIRDCVIIGNTSSIGGGGIHNTFGGTNISSTTFVDNLGSTGGGIHNEGGDPFLSNCVLWSNQAAFGSEIFVQGPILTIEYSTVQGGLGDVYGCCNWQIDWGPSMIDADPLFFDPDDGDFRFLHGSPCIDAGNNLAVSEGVVTDLDGDPRFLDDPDTRDTGNPDPDAPRLPIVDMGPYEYDPDDCNNNDAPDAEDLANGTSQDCNSNTIPDECEIDCNDNDQADDCDVIDGSSDDCNDNLIPDECEADCNNNGQQDDCDIADGISEDCTTNGIPDECEPDCNENGVADSCDIADGTSSDCDASGQPDECQIAEGSPVPGGPFFCDPEVFECDPDCNENGIPDACDISGPLDEDCNNNTIPDDCELDCNDNGVQDDCDIADEFSADCDENGVPDECEDTMPIVEQPEDQEVEAGDLAIFSVVTDGILPEYQWRKDGVELVDSERILGSQSSLLIILDVVLEDAGEYDCLISNNWSCFAISDTATLTVLPASCPADVNDDGVVGPVDLAMLLGAWGPCPDPDTCPADLNADGTVNPLDLAQLLAAWGPCP